MDAEFNYLAKLAAKLPRGLYGDWRDTSHFDLHSRDERYWLDCGSDIFDGCESPCEEQHGKRLGLIMDIAAEVGRLRDGGHLAPVKKETE